MALVYLPTTYVTFAALPQDKILYIVPHGFQLCVFYFGLIFREIILLFEYSDFFLGALLLRVMMRCYIFSVLAGSQLPALVLTKRLAYISYTPSRQNSQAKLCADINSFFMTDISDVYSMRRSAFFKG